MAKTTRTFFLLFSAGVLIFLIAFIKFLKTPDELKILETTAPENPQLEIFNLDPVRGAPEASITIVEFADFLCEHCKRSAGILKEVLRLYPAEVRLVWKDLPATTFPIPSRPLHVAAQCANRQGRFFDYHDQLFAMQGQTIDEDALKETAKRIGLDPFAFEECLSRDETIPLLIDRNVLMAAELGIDGVPYFIVNQTERLSGTTSLEEWKKLIERLRAAK